MCQSLSKFSQMLLVISDRTDNFAKSDVIVAMNCYELLPIIT